MALPNSFQTEDIGAELAVLSTLWNEPLSRASINRILPQFFVNPFHSMLFKEFREMVEKNEPFDTILLTNRIGARASAVEVTGFTLNELVLEREAFEWNIKYLAELYFLRVSLNVSQKIIHHANDRDIENIVKSATSLDRVHSALFARNNHTDHILGAVNEINQRNQLIPTSFKRLNALIGGFTRKDISSVGGKPGHNKTTFVLFDAVQTIKMGLVDKVVYFAVDESGDKIAMRIFASELDISLSDMRNGRVVLDPLVIKEALDKVLGGRLIIVDNLTKDDEIAQAIKDIKPDRAIIDHIQELNYGNEGISDQKVMVACGKFKRAAKDTNANVTIISQVRDKLVDERYDSKIPRPHDFLYASDLRRKSREQCVVYWEYKDSQKELDFAFFDFIVWKSSYSDTGKVKFIIEPDKSRFFERNMSHTVEEPKTDESVWNNLV